MGSFKSMPGKMTKLKTGSNFTLMTPASAPVKAVTPAPAAFPTDQNNPADRALKQLRRAKTRMPFSY